MSFHYMGSDFDIHPNNKFVIDETLRQDYIEFFQVDAKHQKMTWISLRFREFIIDVLSAEHEDIDSMVEKYSAHDINRFLEEYKHIQYPWFIWDLEHLIDPLHTTIMSLIYLFSNRKQELEKGSDYWDQVDDIIKKAA